MKWGFMSIAHIISLLFAVLFCVLFYFGIKKLNRKGQIILLFICSFSGIGAILFNLVRWDSPLEYLPLHMCSINAILLPIAVLTRNKRLSNLLCIWCLGALIALVMNHSVMESDIFSLVFIFYYFPHIFEFLIPLLLFKLGLVKLDSKCIWSSILLTMGIYTIVHFLNILINDYCIDNNIVDNLGNIIKVNYMFSIEPFTPILDLFYKIIPLKYWYMYLSVPILFVYLVIVYFPQIRQRN